MKRNLQFKSVLLTIFLSFIFQNLFAQTELQHKNVYPLEKEVIFLKTNFSKNVSSAKNIDIAANNNITEDAKQKLSDFYSGLIPKSQYFLYVDRHPLKQFVMVCFFDKSSETVINIGIDKISTGNPKRRGYFITPTGVFTNALSSVGYRALGTKNSKGWMGLGAKNSRVWDFGWQKTDKKKSCKIKERKIRLLLHATDPIYGEKELGKRSSKGCIRISAKLNQFLDHYGILDYEFEKHSSQKSIPWLLKEDRQVVAHAGKHVIVSDSGDFLKNL